MRYLLMTTVAACALTAWGRANEEKVPLDKLPKGVLEAAKKRFPKAEAVGASVENDKGKFVYEVQLKEGGKAIDLTLTPDGAITLIEQEIDTKDLPKGVVDALDNKYAKVAYKTVEAVYAVKDGKEVLDFYEVVVTTTDKKEVEVQITADGKIRRETENKKIKKDVPEKK